MDLSQKNRDFISKKFPQLSKTFNAIVPKNEIIRDEESKDYNIKREGFLVYKKGGLADSKAQVDTFIKRPHRIVFSPPSKLFDEVDGKISIKESGDHQFLTQKYDDINSDYHSENWASEVISDLEKQFGSYEKQSVRSDGPYYLIVFGVGLGFHLPLLVKALKPRTLIILDDEPSNFVLSWQTFDWEEFWTEAEAAGTIVKMIVEENQVNLLQRLNGAIMTDCLMGIDGAMSFPHLLTPKLQVVYNEFNSPKTANLASFVGFVADEYNMMKNSFRNLRKGKKRIISTIRKRASDWPAVIVGSGPSLEEHIEWLKSVRNDVVLISSGSSMAVLLKNGIQPDFQCVLERAKAVYDRHEEAAREYDLKRTYAVLTTTIWPGIDEFFKDAVYFIRPALSPLAVFAGDNAEILHGEGPQVTNTAFAFSKRLGFKEYYLLGIDLGSSDPARPRAERAWISPNIKQRNLTIPSRGNFGKTVFTDRSLIQQRQTIENQIRDAKLEGKVFNLGSGVRIAGATPKKPDDVNVKHHKKEREKYVDELFNQFPIYTRERFIGAWESSHAREEIAEYMAGMKKALEEHKTWNPKLMRSLDVLNAYINKTQRKQFAPRLFRGSVLRILMVCQSIFIRTKPEFETETYSIVKDKLLLLLEQLAKEAYDLIDELETEDEYFGVTYVR